MVDVRSESHSQATAAAYAYNAEMASSFRGSPGSHHASLHASAILSQKRARKAAEEDANRLYNRVRQLQKEEEKACKRIEDTKRKAQEILQLRERNEQKQLEKEERLQETKEEKAELEKVLAETKLLSRIEALERKQAVQKEHRKAQAKTVKYRKEKIKAVHEEYDKRLNEEIQARMDKEKELASLAQVEMRLIERLKLRQVQQQKALDQLEAALNLGKKSQAGAAQRLYTPQNTQQPTLPEEPSEEDIARAFSVYDPEGEGSISTQDLEPLMCDLGMSLNPVQLSQAVAQLDRMQSGKISFGEFLLWWKG
ncbi:hypothetical protein WJX72_004409 [[Myrmecia] bisecta]|uniref:EF-hand domain-containing protein n=1 Tax=[Myrmecia] bisecta TaxID=41462 RepID=A0AAW1QEU2_9CHLO